MGLNSQTGIEGSSVSSIACERWQWLNLEAFNCCLRCWVDTDVAECIGGAERLACPLPSGRFGLASLGWLAWHMPSGLAQGIDPSTGWVQ